MDPHRRDELRLLDLPEGQVQQPGRDGDRDQRPQRRSALWPPRGAGAGPAGPQALTRRPPGPVHTGRGRFAFWAATITSQHRTRSPLVPGALRRLFVVSCASDAHSAPPASTLTAERPDPALRPANACLLCPRPREGRSWRLADPGYRTDAACLDRMRERLAEIGKRWAALNPRPGASGEHGGRGAPGF